jgi:hypothetical protein
MNIKKKFGLGAAGLMALGGSMFGLTLISGAAGASSTLPTSTPVTASADQGLNVQDGSQTGVDNTSTGASEGVSSEVSTSEAATSSETGTASDGIGGHQDPAGNVDNQSTTEQ